MTAAVIRFLLYMKNDNIPKLELVPVTRLTSRQKTVRLNAFVLLWISAAINKISAY